jgi:protein-S-isoprenylcysteine O-methyltransferase Ste14
MEKETTFRGLFILSFIVILGMRLYYQWRVLGDKRETEIKESGISILAGSLASLTTLVFGAEYIFFPGTFAFAYLLHYPDWLRWLGAIILYGGIALQWAALHHLGRSFHSLVVSKANHRLVVSGPYRWIRHPIYAAFLLSYVGGGLLASNWVLTFVPAGLYAILVAIRMEEEEALMVELFGQEYVDYQGRTGRLVPRFERSAGGSK